MSWDRWPKCGGTKVPFVFLGPTFAGNRGCCCHRRDRLGAAWGRREQRELAAHRWYAPAWVRDPASAVEVSRNRVRRIPAP